MIKNPGKVSSTGHLNHFAFDGTPPAFRRVFGYYF
jgi:hypothetical protein